MGELMPMGDREPAAILFKTLYQPKDMIDIRALHKDQKRIEDNSKRGWHYEPKPKLYHIEAQSIGKLLPSLQAANREGRNIYFGVNPRVGQSMKDIAAFRCLFLDLDDHNANGDKSVLTGSMATDYLGEVRGDTNLPHPTAVVNSGNGIHFYWRVNWEMDRAEWSIMQKRLIASFSRYADPAIHDAPRIMRLPGFTNHRGGAASTLDHFQLSCYGPQTFAGVPNLKDNAPKPDSTRKPGTGKDASSFSRAAAYFSHREGTNHGNRSNECYKIAAACLCDFALNEYDTEQIILAWNQKNAKLLDLPEIRMVMAKALSGARGSTGSKNREKPQPPPSSPGHLQDATPPSDYAPSSVVGAGKVDYNLLAELLRDCYLVTGTTQVWHSGLKMSMKLEALAAMHPEETKAWRLDRGKKMVRPECLVFRASGVVAENEVNLFQGFTTKLDKRDCPLLREHLAYICDNDPALLEWVTSWLAHQVQHPGIKLATSLVVHGGQGTGKSMFFECFGSIFAPYWGIIGQYELESAFTEWAENKAFILAEEVLAVKQRSVMKNRLKAMVTGRTININQKYLSAYNVECNFNLVFLSNELMPMIVESDDRRYCVIRRDQPKDNDYYFLLAEEIADNGAGRLLNYLLSHPLEEFTAHSKPPYTDAKKELAGVSAPSYEEFLADWLDGGIEELPAMPAGGADLYLAYISWCRLSGAHRYDRGFFLANAKKSKRLEYKKTAGARVYSPLVPANLTNVDHTGFNFKECMENIVKKANKLGV